MSPLGPSDPSPLGRLRRIFSTVVVENMSLTPPRLLGERLCSGDGARLEPPVG
jgi:hypothetical protein